MSKSIIVLRNTISKQTHGYAEDIARKILAHPIWSKTQEEVRVDKPEVLAPEQVIVDGEKVKAADTQTTPPAEVTTEKSK